jgi:hypothetical protein
MQVPVSEVFQVALIVSTEKINIAPHYAVALMTDIN